MDVTNLKTNPSSEMNVGRDKIPGKYVGSTKRIGVSQLKTHMGI